MKNLIFFGMIMCIFSCTTEETDPVSNENPLLNKKWKSATKDIVLCNGISTPMDRTYVFLVDHSVECEIYADSSRCNSTFPYGRWDLESNFYYITYEEPSGGITKLKLIFSDDMKSFCYMIDNYNYCYEAQ